MNNFLRFWFVLLFIFWGFDGVGQTPTPKECGTREPTKEEMIEIIKQEKAFKQSLGTTNNLMGAITVYIKFHNVLKTDWSGRDISSSISTILYYLNQRYSSANITFVQSGAIDYINSSNYYNFDSYCNNINDEINLRNGRDVTNAINIYFVGTITYGTDCSPINGYAYRPTQLNPKSNNIIVIRTEDIDWNDWNSTIVPETIPHEMGHYFNLYHTHQSGGDEVSDTPYDPADKSCVLFCTWFCSNYNPDVRNLMSYYHGCRNRFSPGQYQRMEDYGKTYRTNLNSTLSQRYYLDGLRRILINPTTSNRLFCGGNTISFDYGLYGEPSFVNATSSVRLYNSIGGYYDLGTLITGQNFKTVTIPTNITAGYYDLKIFNSYTSPDVSSTITLYVNGTTSGIATGSPIASQYALATTTLYNATSTCAGNSIALYANVSGYDSYWWTRNGANYTASSTNSSLNAYETGNYTLNMMKCGNVYRSSNSIYLNFYNPTPALTASSNGATTDFRLATCEGSPVTLSAGCQSGMNTLWNDGTTSSIRYINASSTRDFFVNCNNYFCNTGYAPPVRITALNPNVQSQRNGNWQDATLWTSNLVPLNCQTVTIQTGHTVNVPINDAKAKNIILNGKLNFINVSPTVKGKVGLGI